MGKHLHKRFQLDEVTGVFERYLSAEIGVEHVLALLGIGRRRFFDLIASYRESPDTFTLEYKRAPAPGRIGPKAEKKIVAELKKESAIIEDSSNPVSFYNYSYVKEILETKHNVLVSLPTIISRAKKTDFTTRRNIGRPMIARF